jgi:glutamate formiminotransferase / 5-formyltetrahydrofolate cyclo-ligase
MHIPTLMSVPNVSEGRNAATVAAIGAAFTGAGVRLLDVHSDADHHRSVFTLAGTQAQLGDGLLAGAREATARVDVMDPADAGDEAVRAGQHPHVGALDVVPIVYLDERSRGAACAAALVVADRIGSELGVPVFLYGELTGSEPGGVRTRAYLRRGGVAALTQRMAEARPGRLVPDFGPLRPHPGAGATLVAARPPIVAFNLQLAPPATLQHARGIAALIREGGVEGLPGVRAIGVALHGGVAQVSMNIERPFEVSAAAVTDAVRRHAPVASAELVGLAPAAALDGFPPEVPMLGFDPARHIIENALGS